MNTPNTETTLVRKSGTYKVYQDEFNVTDVLAAQSWWQINAHLDIINRYKVKLFIELGTYIGGIVTHIIPNIILDETFHYLGYEINSSVVHPKIKKFALQNPRCQLVLDNMFSESNLEYIRKRIAETSGTVYVFCDGGDKPKELLTFSTFLRKGDIISVHDYTDDQTGEIRDTDLAKIGKDFEYLDEWWRKDVVWLPTFIKVK